MKILVVTYVYNFTYFFFTTPNKVYYVILAKSFGDVYFAEESQVFLGAAPLVHIHLRQRTHKVHTPNP